MNLPVYIKRPSSAFSDRQTPRRMRLQVPYCAFVRGVIGSFLYRGKVIGPEGVSLTQMKWTFFTILAAQGGILQRASSVFRFCTYGSAMFSESVGRCGEEVVMPRLSLSWERGAD